MLLKIYEIITKMQTLIGNGAEVRLSAHDKVFVIRVDWWKDDFHAQREFTKDQMIGFTDNDLILDYFCDYCRNGYDHKKAAEQ